MTNEKQDVQNTTKAYDFAVQKGADRWVPSGGGQEQAITDRMGRKVLYCWNPGQGRHAYIDLGTDMELPRDYCPTEVK